MNIDDKTLALYLLSTLALDSKEFNEKVVRMAVSRLEEISDAGQPDRWISVSDRNPPITGWYIVTVDLGNNRSWVTTCSYSSISELWGYDDVIAWMELPKPYEDCNAQKHSE